MKKIIFLKLSICLFIFSSCAYKPIYKKNPVFKHKINILVKSNDYDKKTYILKDNDTSNTPILIQESWGGAAYLNDSWMDGSREVTAVEELSSGGYIIAIKEIYFRSDRVKNLNTQIKKIKIKKNMGWCNDPTSKNYNSLINVKEKVKKEKMFRKDRKYDLVIVINYNLNKPIPFKGSAIFIHLTNNYYPTAGCIALNKKDMLILLKLINKKSKILLS